MNLRRFLFIFLLLGFTACSVYKSTGRKSFESKAPGNTRALASSSAASSQKNSADISDEEALSHTCWNQPASDPLWHLDPNSSLTVSALSEDEIQVCIQDL